MDEMDTSSSTGSVSEKNGSEGEEISVTPKGDGPEPMVGSPPLFTPIPSTSAMMLAAEAAQIQAQALQSEQNSDVWMSPKRDAMEGVPTDLSALEGIKIDSPIKLKVGRYPQRSINRISHFYCLDCKCEDKDILIGLEYPVVKRDGFHHET